MPFIDTDCLDEPPEGKDDMPEEPRTLGLELLEVVVLPEDAGAEEDAVAVPEELDDAALPPLLDEVVALWARPKTGSSMKQANAIVVILMAIFMESPPPLQSGSLDSDSRSR